MIDYINHTKHKVYLYLLHRTIVRKGVPAPHFKSHTPWPRSPLFKIFVSLPLFSVPPPIKVIKSFPHPYATPSYPNPTNHPSLHIINKFEQISKGWFYQLNWVCSWMDESVRILGLTFSSELDWCSYIISYFLKQPPRKLEPWFVLSSFFLLRLLFISINLPCSHAWNTIVMTGMVLLVAAWNC